MIDHSIFDDTEPPPSYEEAVGGSSSNNPFRRRPPPPPPRRTPRPLSQIYTTNNSSSSSSNNPFNHNNSNPKTNNNVNRSNSTPVRNGNPYSTPPTTPSGSSSSSTTTTTTTTTAPTRHPAQTFQQILPAIQPPRQFPPSFNLYRDAFPSRRSFFLGEHQADPLYAVTAWTGWSSRANLVLHNGAAEDAPPLATVSYDPWGRRMDVSLPPPPSQTTASIASIANAPISIQVPTAARQKFVFRVDIPWPHSAVAGGGQQQQRSRKESFEWRRSSSPAVAGLGGRSQGWKLVRLSGEVPPHDPSALAAAVLGSGPRSGGDDGCEVVAVCAQAVMSMTKLWKFAFLGTGVSGALGERWAVMAVVTGLAIWDQESRGN
ncbi:hypothetical protein VPNG_04098 [Cytospora leucostoma]|uniref:Uncharacterized protein n=1 Tax=Cytospora leucostoma TaxID=1230097 RepID=A0A423XDB8_9PEZI|nr:hypothetical protein VPNG_04098 [Cytospora leucostoma]